MEAASHDRPLPGMTPRGQSGGAPPGGGGLLGRGGPEGPAGGSRCWPGVAVRLAPLGSSELGARPDLGVHAEAAGRREAQCWEAEVEVRFIMVAAPPLGWRGSRSLLTTATSTATSAVARDGGMAVITLRDREACGSPYGGIEGGVGLTRSSRGRAGELQGSINTRYNYHLPTFTSPFLCLGSPRPDT